MPTGWDVGSLRLANSRELERIRDVNARRQADDASCWCSAGAISLIARCLRPTTCSRSSSHCFAARSTRASSLSSSSTLSGAAVEMDPGSSSCSSRTSCPMPPMRWPSTARCGSRVARTAQSGSATALTAGDYISIVISDTGRGMDADARETRVRAVLHDAPGQTRRARTLDRACIASDATGTVILDSTPAKRDAGRAAPARRPRRRSPPARPRATSVSCSSRTMMVCARSHARRSRRPATRSWR